MTIYPVIYPVKYNKQYLELGALELGEAFAPLYEKAQKNASGEILFINEKEESRYFGYSPEEGFLQGRGIKGFFKGYTEGVLLMEPLSEESFSKLALSRESASAKDNLGVRENSLKVRNTVNVHNAMNACNGFNAYNARTTHADLNAHSAMNANNGLPEVIKGFRIHSSRLLLPEKPGSPSSAGPAVRERTGEVLESLSCFKSDEERWFRLYELSRYFEAGNDNVDLVCSGHLRELTPYGYQVRTVKAVLRRFRGRVLLCDEVGLGKTVEAGIAMLEYVMRGLAKKILVLVPPSLVEQWYTEMKRKFNLDFIKSDDPAFRAMGDEAWGHYGKVIASIAQAKRKGNCEIISQIQYDLIIVDEAHHLKNRASVAWQFVNSLRKKYIFLLTATPVQNNLEELYNLITLLKPGQLRTYAHFKRNFIEDREGMEAKNVKKLRELLDGVLIRNRRSDVDIRFTRRFASTLTLPLPAREKRLYEAISAFIRVQYQQEGKGEKTFTRLVLKNLQEQMGSSFTTLPDSLKGLLERNASSKELSGVLKGFYEEARLIADDSSYESEKIKRLLAIIKEFKDKIIVFTKYRTTLEYIVSILKRQGIKTAVFHGGLRRIEKEAQIQYFKEDADILVSTEAGGEGRNLQFSNCMVNYDLPWNPMAIEQRIGRIHRVGQERDVYVYNLASSDTVEHYILELLDKKINMFEMVVGEVDMILGDIEEESDFSDLIMDAWTRSDSPEEMQRQMERLGEKMLENKKQMLKIKDLDNTLFEDSFAVTDIAEE